MDNYYALIMAGGGGTRLWPLSRKNRPKQMLSLVGSNSLFHISVTRLASLFPPGRIFVVAGESQVEALRADVPELPAENFIIEPFGMDSGPAAALGVAHIAKINPDAVIAILTADHYIGDVWGFCDALRAAHEVAQKGFIVTLGIKPTYPATGFGYIQQGEELITAYNLKIYHSSGFKEKPDNDTARQFVDSKQYSWNSGMFIWSAAQALDEFKRQQPGLYDLLTTIQSAHASADYRATIEKVWSQMPKISLDYAVMEKAEKVAMIPIDIGWSDIGSWAAVYDELAGASGENVMMGDGSHVDIDAHGALINSNRMVVTIGVDNLVIVDTDDVLMICTRDRAQDVKLAVQHMKDHKLDRYL
ncbi:MAG TPA: sugar phosphate nucleotidyltransferase [Aggregatilineales bacterium]|nr:sugar phosphate nucleotidyltransferase [Aggregatilineales bacterium]